MGFNNKLVLLLIGILVLMNLMINANARTYGYSVGEASAKYIWERTPETGTDTWRNVQNQDYKWEIFDVGQSSYLHDGTGTNKRTGKTCRDVIKADIDCGDDYTYYSEERDQYLKCEICAGDTVESCGEPRGIECRASQWGPQRYDFRLYGTGRCSSDYGQHKVDVQETRLFGIAQGGLGYKKIYTWDCPQDDGEGFFGSGVDIAESIDFSIILPDTELFRSVAITPFDDLVVRATVASEGELKNKISGARVRLIARKCDNLIPTTYCNRDTQEDIIITSRSLSFSRSEETIYGKVDYYEWEIPSNEWAYDEIINFFAEADNDAPQIHRFLVADLKTDIGVLENKREATIYDYNWVKIEEICDGIDNTPSDSCDADEVERTFSCDALGLQQCLEEESCRLISGTPVLTGSAVGDRCEVCQGVCGNKAPEVIGKTDLGVAYGSVEGGFKFNKVKIDKKAGTIIADDSDIGKTLADILSSGFIPPFYHYQDECTAFENIKVGFSNFKDGEYIEDLVFKPNNMIEEDLPVTLPFKKPEWKDSLRMFVKYGDDGSYAKEFPQEGEFENLDCSAPDSKHKRFKIDEAVVTLCPDIRSYQGKIGIERNAKHLILPRSPDNLFDISLKLNDVAYSKDSSIVGYPSSYTLMITLGGMWYTKFFKERNIFNELRNKVLAMTPPDVLIENSGKTREELFGHVWEAIKGNASKINTHVWIEETIRITVTYVENENTKESYIHYEIDDNFEIRHDNKNGRILYPSKIKPIEYDWPKRREPFLGGGKPSERIQKVWKNEIKTVVEERVLNLPERRVDDNNPNSPLIFKDALEAEGFVFLVKGQPWEDLDELKGFMSSLGTKGDEPIGGRSNSMVKCIARDSIKSEDSVYILRDAFDYNFEGEGYRVSFNKDVESVKKFLKNNLNAPQIIRLADEEINSICDTSVINTERFSTDNEKMFKTQDGNFQVSFDDKIPSGNLVIEKVQISNCDYRKGLEVADVELPDLSGIDFSDLDYKINLENMLYVTNLYLNDYIENSDVFDIIGKWKAD